MVDGNASRSGQSGSFRRLSQRVHFPIQPSQIGVTRQAVLPLGPASVASAPGPLCRPDLTTCRRWWRQVNTHVPECRYGSCCGLTEQGLEFGEGWFDGMEVWGIGRQIKQGSACCFDGLAPPGHLMAGQIVQDDHIAARQFGTEHLAHIFEEDRTVPGPSTTQGAAMRSWRSAATNVEVFQ